MEASVFYNSVLEPLKKAGVQSIFPSGLSIFSFQVCISKCFFPCRLRVFLNRKFPMALVIIGHFAWLYLKLSACPLQDPVCLLENV